jgi:hypothetical protein
MGYSWNSSSILFIRHLLIQSNNSAHSLTLIINEQVQSRHCAKWPSSLLLKNLASVSRKSLQGKSQLNLLCKSIKPNLCSSRNSWSIDKVKMGLTPSIMVLEKIADVWIWKNLNKRKSLEIRIY